MSKRELRAIALSKIFVPTVVVQPKKKVIKEKVVPPLPSSRPPSLPMPVAVAKHEQRPNLPKLPPKPLAFKNVVKTVDTRQQILNSSEKIVVYHLESNSLTEPTEIPLMGNMNLFKYKFKKWRETTSSSEREEEYDVGLFISPNESYMATVDIVVKESTLVKKALCTQKNMSYQLRIAEPSLEISLSNTMSVLHNSLPFSALQFNHYDKKEQLAFPEIEYLTPIKADAPIHCEMTISIFKPI